MLLCRKMGFLAHLMSWENSQSGMGQEDLQQPDWSWWQIKEHDDFLGADKSVCDPHSRETEDINSIAETGGKHQKIFRRERKNYISGALVSDFVHLEFGWFACRSGSKIRSSTKCQSPFFWLPLLSLTSRVRALSEETLVVSDQVWTCPCTSPVLGQWDLWCTIALPADPRMQLQYLQLHLNAKYSRIYPASGHRSKKLLCLSLVMAVYQARYNNHEG